MLLILSFPAYFAFLNHSSSFQDSSTRRDRCDCNEKADFQEMKDKVKERDEQKKKKNLVVGLAAGNGSLSGLYRFVCSFRYSNKLDDVIVFIPKEELSWELRKLSRDFSVKFVTFELSDLAERLRKNHPSTYRFTLMSEYLKRKVQCGSLIESFSDKGCNKEITYHLVLMSDLRDAVFQRDPFVQFWEKLPAEHLKSDQIFFAIQEEGSRRIGEEWFNREWVKSCFGIEVLNRISNQRISCSGTSMATYDAALIYLSMMQEKIFTDNHCEANGIDQGVHNVFVYDGRLKKRNVNVVLYPLETGPVATLGFMQVLQKNLWGEILNEFGEVYSMVHQIDR